MKQVTDSKTSPMGGDVPERGALIFANPVFKNSGILVLRNISYERSVNN